MTKIFCTRGNISYKWQRRTHRKPLIHRKKRPINGQELKDGVVKFLQPEEFRHLKELLMKYRVKQTPDQFERKGRKDTRKKEESKTKWTQFKIKYKGIYRFF